MRWSIGFKLNCCYWQPVNIEQKFTITAIYLEAHYTMHRRISWLYFHNNTKPINKSMHLEHLYKEQCIYYYLLVDLGSFW